MSLIFQILIWFFFALLALIALDVISRVAVSIKMGATNPDKKFNWKKLLLFYKTNVAPYALVWLALAVIPYLLQKLSDWLNFSISLNGIIAIESVIGLFWAFIVSRLVQSIFASWHDLQIEVKNNNQ